jgi:putative hydrolase of the HAD superfamily
MCERSVHSSPMGIDAVVFDWGGVLAGGVSRDLAEVEQRLGVPAGSLPGLMGMHPCDTDVENLWHMRELGRATSLEWAKWYSERIAAAGGAPLLTPEQMVATEATIFNPPQNTIVLDTVRQLHLDGYKLAICTNNFTEIGDVWRTGLPLDLFDAVVVSCEIGCRKPDAEMFDHVADRLGVDPESVVLVDDFEANVDGARRAGWHGLLVGSDHAAAMAALTALLDEHPRPAHP